jgi:hypothetical protein
LAARDSDSHYQQSRATAELQGSPNPAQRAQASREWRHKKRGKQKWDS